MTNKDLPIIVLYCMFAYAAVRMILPVSLFIFIFIEKFYEKKSKTKISARKPLLLKKHKSIWVRTKGRLKRIIYVDDIDIEPENLYNKFHPTEEELEQVKKILLPLFNSCDDLFKTRVWYRVGGRLIRKR